MLSGCLGLQILHQLLCVVDAAVHPFPGEPVAHEGVFLANLESDRPLSPRDGSVIFFVKFEELVRCALLRILHVLQVDHPLWILQELLQCFGTPPDEVHVRRVLRRALIEQLKVIVGRFTIFKACYAA